MKVHSIPRCFDIVTPTDQIVIKSWAYSSAKLVFLCFAHLEPGMLTREFKNDKTIFRLLEFKFDQAFSKES